MLNADRLFFVVNPKAGNGSALRKWPKIRQVLADNAVAYDWSLTRRPGHATEIVRQALEKGYRTVVSVGGDGTINEVVNGLVDATGKSTPGVKLGLIPAGTGSDLVRSLKIPVSCRQSVDRLLNGGVRRMDIGKVECVGFCGERVLRYFVNVADAGLGGETAARANRRSKAMGGFLSFLCSAVATFLSYRNQMADLKVDESEIPSVPLSIVAVANGQYLGGGMHIAPQAVTDDGLFDVLILHSLSRPELLFNLPKVYSGNHIGHPKLTMMRGRRVCVHSDHPLVIQADGEIVGHVPAEFSILHGVVAVVC